MSNKLLLADDSITIRKVVGIIFANEDYALTVVDNGKTALEKAREIIPDVILADVLMPGCTGYEVCAEIRRDPALKHIPLLLLTGAFEPFDEEKARQSGADDFISKPFESQQLIEKVKSLIALGEQRKVSQPVLEPAAATPPLLSPEQFTAPSPEVPVLGEMGGVFLEVEEVAEVQSLQMDQLSDLEEVAEVQSPQMDQLSNLEEVAEEPTFQTAQLTAADEIGEASPEDDLWDVFTLEEVAEGEAGDLEAVLEEEVGEPFSEDETIGAYSFAEEEETNLLDTGLETDGAPSLATADMFDHIGEEQEYQPAAEPVAGGVFEFAAEPAEQTSVVSGLDSPPPVMAAAEPEFELQFAPEEEYVPVSTPVEPIAPPLPPAAPVTLSPAVQGEPALSEEQLASLVAKISRDIIEKIAWEVVPDLAETLIRDEIRRLKEGLRG